MSRVRWTAPLSKLRSGEPVAMLALLTLVSCAGAPRSGQSTDRPSPLRVFILAGQSNMVGFGQVSSTPPKAGTLEALVANEKGLEHLLGADGDWALRDDVSISFFERHGPLGVGYGADERMIGPEFGFGHAMGEHLDRPVLLIKVAWGGKSLGVDFRPPSAGGTVGPNYTAMFEEIDRVLEGLDETFPELAAHPVELAGLGWHQGWNDRVNQELNDQYEQNLVHFIADVRARLGVPDLPFVIAETGMSGHAETHPRALSLMAAQAAAAARPEFAGTVAFVPTRSHFRPKEQSPTGQAYHWNGNAETYFLIGRDMGRAMCELMAIKD